MGFARLVHSASSGTQGLSERGDDELMTLAQAGSRDAFAVLVERYAHRLVATCARFTHDGEQAIELAQQTWVLVWEQRDRYRPEGGFLLWLTTIGRNRCRNELRRSKVARRHAEVAPESSPTPAQIEALLVGERRRKVREALCRLPAPMREALVMRYGEELRYDEMAVVLGASESTLRSRVHHGLLRLKNLLEKRK